MKKSILSLTLLSALAVSALNAQSVVDNAPLHRPHKIGRILHQLDLTDMQQQQLGELRSELREKRIAMRSTHTRPNVGDYFRSNSFDKNGFIRDMTSHFQQRIETRADFLERVYQILDARQREMFVQMLTKRKGDQR